MGLAMSHHHWIRRPNQTCFFTPHIPIDSFLAIRFMHEAIEGEPCIYLGDAVVLLKLSCLFDQEIRAP
jgi:hypothetical protein